MTSAARVWEIVGINDPVAWPLVGVNAALGRDPVAWAILNPAPLWSGTRNEMTGTARVAVLAAARADGSFRASGRSRAAIAVSGQVLRSIPLTGAAAITTAAAGRAERGRGLLLTGTASIALVAAGAASRASLMTGAAVVSFTATGSAASYTDATGKARIAFGAAGWMRRGSTLSGTASASVTAEAANRRARPLTGAAGLSVAASGAAERVITASGEAAVAFVTEGKASRARSLGGSAALATIADGALRRGRMIEGAAAVGFSAAGQIEKEEPSGGIVATGGTVTDVTINGEPWRVHTFLDDGTLSVTQGGEGEAFILAGGGGGGRGGNYTGGGGGGGGIVIEPVVLEPGDYPIVVGEGGLGANGNDIPRATSGGDSSAFGLTAMGGGAGGQSDAYLALEGGSGGGGDGGNIDIGPGAAGTPGQGHDGADGRGGTGGPGQSFRAGGGGGGAGAAAPATDFDGQGGAGGAGLVVNFDGTEQAYGGGGGGAGRQQGGAGGIGGGGSGSNTSTESTSGTDGLGGGGGGGTNGLVGGTGGSGRVMVRYRLGGGGPSTGDPGEPLPAGTISPLSTANAAEAAKGNNIVGRDGVGHDTNDPFNAHRVAALAWHAAAGVQTHDAKLVEHLKSLAGGGSPSLKLESGYGAQQATGPLAAIAMARYIPRIWNALTATERSRLGLLIDSALYAAAFTVSENSAYGSGGKTEQSLRGDTNTARNWNPNYRFGQSSHIGIAAAFYAADGNPSTILKQKTDHFNFNNHVDALASSGLSNTHKTWVRENWPSAPSASEIQSAIRNFSRYGGNMSSWWNITISDANTTFNRVSSPGLNGGAGVAGGWGRIAQGASGLPTAGQMGMATELDSTDGGGARSSLDYAWGGAIIAVPTWAALIVAGLVDKGRADVIAHWNRLRVGYQDLKYKWEQGYYNYSNGQPRGHWRLDAPAGSNYHGNPDTWGHWHGMDLWEKVIAYVLGDQSGGG